MGIMNYMKQIWRYEINYVACMSVYIYVCGSTKVGLWAYNG